MKKFKYWLAVAVTLIQMSPVVTFAAYDDVTTDGTADIVLPGNSLTYNIVSNSKTVYYKINGDSSIEVSMDNGSLVQVTSNDKSSFAVTNAGSCSVETICAGQSYAYITCTSAQIVTLTMGAINSCTGSSSGGGTNGGGSSGGSSSGGGGGGGGSSAPAVAVVAPVVVAAPVAVTKVEEKKTVSQVVSALAVGKPQTVEVSGKTSKATVIKFAKGVATVTIKAKTSNIASLKLKQYKTIDTDGNKLEDLKVTFSQIVDGKPEFTFEPVKEVYVFATTLKKGSGGDAVKWLQVKLQSLGYLPSSVKITTNFGPATLAALKSFQSDKGLKISGTTDAATRTVLNKE